MAMTEQERANESAATLSGETCNACEHLRFGHKNYACVAHVVVFSPDIYWVDSTAATYNEPRSLEGKDPGRYGCDKWKKRVRSSAFDEEADDDD